MRPTEDFDLPALLMAMAMAALAGATDVYGLVRLHDLFVSFMSGNTTMMALAIGEGHGARVALIGGIIGLFVAGAAVGSFIGALTGRAHAAAVMALVAGLLAVPVVHDLWMVPCLALAMGALNATMTKIGETAVSLTYVTGSLVKLGSGLGRWLAGVREPRDWLLNAPIWLSLFSGAVAAAMLHARFGPRWYWLLPSAAALLVPVLARQGWRSERSG